MTLETLSQLFDFATSQYNRPDLLIYRGKDNRFHNISTNEFRDRVVYFAIGLRKLGVKPQARILLLCENRPEWHIVDFASHLLAAVLVPVFPTLPPNQIEYIINNSGSEHVIVSSKAQAGKIEQIKAQIPKVKSYILCDDAEGGGDFLSLDDVLQDGREADDSNFYDQALQVAQPDSLATIIYTSGTTGVPKGVMLTHKNLISNMLDCSTVLSLTPADKGISFLPLCHAIERTVDYVYFSQGLSIVYSASKEHLPQDLQESGPTIMANVPRFYEKVKAKIEAAVEREGGLKKRIFKWAMAIGASKSRKMLANKPLGILLRLKYALAHKLVLHKIQERTGGHVRFFVSGGAPLSAEVAEFFHAAGLTILEGYGLSEAAPVISVNSLEQLKFGTVGPVLPSVEVKFAQDGELLARGPNVMAGYYKMPDETAEVLQDGWLHTGDIGFLDDEGFLHITDRKKELIVTSVGKNVAPQALQKALENSKYIEQVLVLGDRRRFIGALIVPDFEQLQMFAEKEGLTTSPAELVKHEVVLKLISSEIDEYQAKFADYEKIRKFELLPEPFTIENGKLTPTMKVKRKVVVEEYADLIESIYAD